MNVAVDAMGGDNAPEVVVEGAVGAVSELGIPVTLVGHREILGKILDAYKTSDLISVHHCEDMVHMDETPLKAVRQKKDASIRVAFDLVKSGAADAVVSAGNSGAILAAGVLILGRIKGVDRPAIAGIFPLKRGLPFLLMWERMWIAGLRISCSSALWRRHLQIPASELKTPESACSASAKKKAKAMNRCACPIGYSEKVP